MKQLKGNIVAILTPFDDDGRPSEKLMEALLEHVITGGIDGLFICGTTGLGPIMDIEERKMVAETYVTTTRRDLIKIVQVGSASVQDALNLAKHADSIGADAIAAFPPLYYRFSYAEILNFYRLTSKGTSLPLVLYNIPQFTNVNLTPTFVREVRETLENCRGIKDSSSNLGQMIETKLLCGEGFSVLNGGEDLVLPSLVHGLDGTITGITNAFPSLVGEVKTCYGSGDLKRATMLQEAIVRITRTISQNYIPALYAVLKDMGIDVGRPKPPMAELPYDVRSAILEEVRRVVQAISR